MSRSSSAVIDQSGKWAPAGEILEAAGSPKATAVGSNNSLPSNESNEAGPSDQTAPTNTANGSVLSSDTNINAPPTAVVPTLPFTPPPPPPPLPNPIFKSNALPTTRPAGSSIPLVPFRRTTQSPQPPSGTNPAPQSSRIGSATTPRTSLHPPRQGSYGPTGPTPYMGGPMTPTSYPSQPSQHTSSSAPRISASPAAMSSYGSPPPNLYQSPAPYPLPHSQRPASSPAQTQYSSYGTPAGSYPGQPIPLRSQRPATTGAASASQTPASQSIYGAPQTPASQSMYGTSPAYPPVPQQVSNTPAAQTPGSQSMYGTSQTYGSSAQPGSARPQGSVTPGAPLLPYSNLPQQPVAVGGPNTPARKRTDAFVANDPFRRHSSSKHDRPSDDLTFDDIPVAGATVVSQPWSKYDPSSSEIPTSQSYSQPSWGPASAPPASYPIQSYSQPTSGPASAPPASYPINSVNSGQQNQSQPQSTVSWRPSQPSPYELSQNNTANPPLTYTGSSPYAPVYVRPSSTTNSPMPYNGSSQYPPYPQGPLQQMPPPLGDTTGRTYSPAPTNQPPVQLPNTVATTPLTGPPPTSSSDINLIHHHSEPTPEPINEGSPRHDDGERPQSPISRPTTPVYRPPDTYPPPTFEYPRLYDPNDPSTFPLDSPTFPPYNPYLPPDNAPFGMFPMLTPKQSIWSRVGEVFRWPFSRRRHDDDSGPYIPSLSSEESNPGYPSLVVRFILKTMPREVYLHFLLRLPSLYFSRVARIFEEADLTLPEIKKMALETASQGKNTKFDIQVFESQNVPPEYDRLKSTWEAFIDSVMREWKTFNIISVLLLSAILTILQIQSAAEDPLTRYFAIFSLICALISLLFGCMYIIRFGSMRKTYKAAEWALEAKKSKTVIWWNVWVLLAMPAVWLTWSIMLYIACIMSFVWRTSAQGANPPGDLSKSALLAVRVVITIVLGIGVLYGWLILSTFSRYGEAMDKAWKQRIDGWLDEKAVAQQYLPQSTAPYTPYPYFDASSPRPQSSQFPGYSETVPDYRSSAPAYSSQPYDGGYSSDSKVGYSGPDFGPTYANAGYVPPPEPYDSPAQSRSGSPQSTSSTLYATRVNTQYNKTSGLQREDSMSSAIYDGPAYSTQHPLPPPAKLYSNMPPPRLVPQKIPLAVPPGPNLPPIPGTPAFTNRSSANPSLREGDADDAEDGDNNSVAGSRPKNDAEDEAHVHFRSPLFSEQGSFSFGGSDHEVEEPLLSAAEASSSSFTARVSPVSSEHGDSSSFAAK